MDAGDGSPNPNDNAGESEAQLIAKLIQSLREVITQQTNTIELARAEIQEVKSEQNALREQNTRL